MVGKFFVLLTGMALILALAGCGSSSDGLADVTVADVDGNTAIDADALSTELDTLQAGELTREETDGLLYMREEEKLARDVYWALNEQWSLSVFQNISNSEQTHTDAVEVLLDRYGLSDPSANRGTGEFSNVELQSLYDQLVAQGSQSRSDALKVGAAIEEIDILDLQQHLVQTEKQDIVLVYENLMKGSRNHLRSFVSALQNQSGETYQPQYLDEAEYDAIIDAPMERGGRG